MTVKYCPICHKKAYELVEEGELVKVVSYDGTVPIKVGKNSTVSMTLQCPDKHRVKVQVGEESKEGVTRQRSSYL